MKWQDILYIVLVLLLFMGGAWYSKFQWDMCREAGLEFWYCVQHIG